METAFPFASLQVKKYLTPPVEITIPFSKFRIREM